ncbi:TIGR04219 family outer membrane beta-barrel protein [Vibrio owensii]|uniref:TIGR04219 family outer membrane beta-barrel protein n=1 Tax=Vibrio harveyi group TaxID=717610 RepID=UPI003CC5DF25
MKKLLFALFAVTLSTGAMADMILGGDIELNAWQQKHSSLGKDGDNDLSLTVEASLEHPIPLLPNFKVAQSTIDNEQVSFIKQDYALYYEILDNGLVSTDIGFGVSSFSEGELKGQEPIHFEGFVPIVYAAAEVGIPATPLYVFARGNGVSYSDSEIIDLTVGVRYAIPLKVFQVELQAGYRTQDIKLKEFDDLPVTLDTSTDGFFLGVNLDF